MLTAILVVKVLVLALLAFGYRRRWTAMRTQYGDLRRTYDTLHSQWTQERAQRADVETRLAEIRTMIARRPLRRKWLALSRRVATLAAR